ncbi:MAG TPA: (d)CMP kinase [Clostridiales bacterium]|nr:(d)CMP kinase [Clostridiales bacterium]
MQKAIAIDGPSGAGKSTIAKLVAEKLGFRYIDTGAMYRACALKALRLSLDVNDEAAISAMAKGIEVRLERKNGLPLIFLDGEDVTAAIRSAEVTRDVPIVCRYAKVRETMVEIQRGLAENGGGVVMDGRDIGTNVLPQAVLKIFLTADVQERGRRRYAEWKAKGIATEWSGEEIVADLTRRDQLDSTREINPLRQAEDAILLDSTALTIEETADRIIALWKEKTKDVL